MAGLTTLQPDRSPSLSVIDAEAYSVLFVNCKLEHLCCRLLLDTLEKGGQQAQAAALAAEVKALGITPARSMQL